MLKTLSKSIRQYKRATILAPIFMVSEIVMEVMIPFLMSLLIDKGIDVGDMSYIIKIGALLVVTAIVSLGLGAFCGTLAARASSGFASNLRQDIYGKIMGFSFKNTNKFSSASLVTRVTTDVTNVQNAYQMLIRQAVRSPVLLVAALIMAFTINPSISLIYIAVVPVLGVGLFLIIYKVFPLFQRVLVKYDRLNKVVQENIKGIRVVKSYVREDEEKQKFEEISTDIFNTHSKAAKRVAFNAPLMQFCVYTCMLLIAWIGARLVVGGSMSTGQLMSFFTYTMHILMSLMLLSMVAVSLLISRASAVRIVEVLNEQPDIANPQNPITAIKDGSITFSDVNFSYVGASDKLCLMDIDLEIKSGEVIGIIGGTGSSKTSLVQLIPRLYDRTGGVVSVGGIDVKEYDIETLRDSVAVVLQKNVLFSGTINENLRWGSPDATDEEIRYACQLAQAHGFIQSFPKGYETHIEQGGTNVSGGQKQRLCIARALLKKPKILILDDSTSAVDTSTESLIRKALRTELPQTTKIIIAQRVTSVQGADKIIVMEGGRINGIGTHSELINNNEIYKEVFKTQESGGDFDEQ